MFEQATQLLNAANVGHAADIAQEHACGGADKGLLSNIISSVMSGNDKPTSADTNEINYAAQAYNKIYGQNQQTSSTNDLGSAAAVQALKLFTGKGASGGSDQIVGLAMGEAMKLFSSGNNAGASQNDILKTAVMWAMKFFLTKQQGASNPAFGLLMGLVNGNNNQQQQPQQQEQPQQQPSNKKKTSIGNIASSVLNNFLHK